MTVRARSLRLAVPLAFAGLAALLVGCPESASSGAGGGATPPASGSSAATPTPSAVASAAPAMPEAAPPPPCTAEAAFTIDKGGRADTGLTAVELQNGKQVAIGYAVGADGIPKVALVDDLGAVTQANPDWSHVHDSEPKKDPAMVRHLSRVTPLGLMKGGKMRIGMDFIDSFAEKGKGSYLRCGPAEQEPVISDDGGAQFDDPTEDEVAKLAAASDTDMGTVDFRDCRTFGGVTRAFVLATQVKREGPGDDHNLLYSWLIDEVPGKGVIKDAAVDKRVVKPGKDGHYPKIDHFATPVAIPMGDLGVMITARDQGNIVFVKRTAKLEKAGEPKSMWLGAAVGMPALNMENGQVYVMTTEFQKTDLYGVLFPATSAPDKPQKIPLNDPNPPSDTRDSASLDVTSSGDIAVAFVDGKSPQRHVRMTVLGSDLKQKLAGVFDVSPPEANVSEARIVSLVSGKFLVTYLRTDGQLNGQLVSCKY